VLFVAITVKKLLNLVLRVLKKFDDLITFLSELDRQTDTKV